jgi:hypothetical protein
MFGCWSPVYVIFCTSLLLAAMSAGAGAPGELPAVRPQHPRLLITAEDLPRLQRQVKAYPEVWQRMVSSAVREPTDDAYGDAFALRNTALVYVITRGEIYLRSAATLAEHLARTHKLDVYASPEVLFSLALAYDWLYPELTDQQRAELAEAMLRIANYCDRKIWRHSDFNNHFALEKVWPFVYAGLALQGDVLDPRVEELLRTGSDLLHNHLIPAANFMADATGGQHEGYGYDAWGYMRPLAWVMEAWRTATGEDLFPGCTAARYSALWNIYGRRPFDHRQEHCDDASLRKAWSAGDEGAYIYLLAYRYQDGRAQWMGDQIAREYDVMLWPIILWRDPGLAPRPPTDLPTARLFDRLGWVLMRSSWEDDATFASFQCGPFLTGHQHLDNNAFTIHKRSLLALDSGVNAYGESVRTDYRTNYYSRTIAHNTITIFDAGEAFRGGPWALEDSGGANDGGQLRLRGLQRVDEVPQRDRWDVGHVVTYRHDPLFTYAVGDATKSYSSAKLRLFLRHFLFLPPNLFVVFDQVTATDPGFRKAWLLHSVGEPQIANGVVSIADGPGRLVCRTVLPERAVITKTGGPGKECWVEGRNWPPVEREWTEAAGAWRTEVSPSLPAAEDLFLHVLEVDGDEIASSGNVSLVRESGRVGMRVHAQGRNYLATFPLHGGASGRLQITENAKVLLDTELR